MRGVMAIGEVVTVRMGVEARRGFVYTVRRKGEPRRIDVIFVEVLRFDPEVVRLL